MASVLQIDMVPNPEQRLQVAFSDGVAAMHRGMHGWPPVPHAGKDLIGQDQLKQYLAVGVPRSDLASLYIKVGNWSDAGQRSTALKISPLASLKLSMRSLPSDP